MKSVGVIEYMFNSCHSLNTTITFNFDSSKIATYKGTFNYAATNDNAKIIVNYTSSAKDIIDNVINTKAIVTKK